MSRYEITVRHIDDSGHVIASATASAEVADENADETDQIEAGHSRGLGEAIGAALRGLSSAGFRSTHQNPLATAAFAAGHLINMTGEDEAATVVRSFRPAIWEWFVKNR